MAILMKISLLLLAVSRGQAGTYSEHKALYDTLLASSNYNPEQRPLLNQSHTLSVRAIFELVSIVEINDVFQSFRCNGFIGLFWTDEILQWNTSDYGGETVIAPKITSVFRPKLIMLNTIEDRDLFGDNYSPLSVYYDGRVVWAPGSIFPASCKLDLTKYPFDKQNCQIQMLTMNFDDSELRFTAPEATVGDVFYTQNGQWDILNMSIETSSQNIGVEIKSVIVISFEVKRKPTFLVISMLLPIVFLSLLNLMVFVIPVDSGEKISYGITVLLALSVFMSIISGLLPSSSESMPLMVSYIFILMIISVLTVVVTIIITGLHNMEEEEEKSLKAKANFKALLPKIKLFRKAVSPLTKLSKVSEDITNQNRAEMNSANAEYGDSTVQTKLSQPIFQKNVDPEKAPVNNYKLIGKHIDMVSLIVFAVIWVSVTIGFMSAIAA